MDYRPAESASIVKQTGRFCAKTLKIFEPIISAVILVLELGLWFKKPQNKQRMVSVHSNTVELTKSSE